MWGCVSILLLSLVVLCTFSHPIIKDSRTTLRRIKHVIRQNSYWGWVFVFLPWRLLFKVDGRWSRSLNRLKVQVSNAGLEFLEIFLFLPGFYHASDLLWQEGLLVDFLQKKSVDKAVRTCMIFTGYLFSERVVLDIVVRFYIDYVLWSGRAAVILEFSNITWTLFITLIGFVFMFLLVVFCYSCLLLV